MRDQPAINAKISAALTGKQHPLKGVAGKKHTEESRAKISAGVLKKLGDKPRRSEAQRRAKNVANVIAYRARKRNAILPTSDLKLISKIYEHCPDDYHVDHIVSLASGGPHHQDNLQYLPALENCRKNARNLYDETLVIRWQDMFLDSSVGRATD